MPVVTPTETIESDQVDSEIGEYIVSDSQEEMTVDDINRMSSSEIKKVLRKNKRKYSDDDCIVIKEKDYNKKGVVSKVTESRDYNEDDRVLHTSFYLSPYAINLLGIIKRNSITKGGDVQVLSKPKVILNVTSSSINSFYESMMDRYNVISNINQLAAGINASSGKVTIIQPKLKIEIADGEEYERIDALVLSSVLTKLKMLSEEFGTSTSWIAEYLIYEYVNTSGDINFDKYKKYCKERMDAFLLQLDNFIKGCTSTNKEDENALIQIAYKLLASEIISQTMTNNVFEGIEKYISGNISLDVWDDYNINLRTTVRPKSGKRSYDESHSKGIFKQKTGRKQRKEGVKDE